MNAKISLLFMGAFAVAMAAQPTSSPARLRADVMPTLPSTTVGGGQVILEVTVNAAGRVAEIVPLRTTPPFTELTVAAVRQWQFAPATIARPQGTGEPAAPVEVPSEVLVAAEYHAPALTGPTLGEPPRDIAAASNEVAFPLKISAPPFPPSAAGSGVVLLEARLNRSGRVVETVVKHSAPPFDDAAQTALRAWTFRPAPTAGAAGPTFVYVMFGFPVPLVNRPQRE